MWAGEQPSDNGQSPVVVRYPNCSPAVKETSSSALGMSSDVSLKILRDRCSWRKGGKHPIRDKVGLRKKAFLGSAPVGGGKQCC